MWREESLGESPGFWHENWVDIGVVIKIRNAEKKQIGEIKRSI